MNAVTSHSPAAVYRHLNANGETLYIGCSAAPSTRFDVHRSQSPWAREVTRIDVQWFDTLAEARRVESQLIHAERPPMNKEWQGINDIQTLGQSRFMEWQRETGVTAAQVAKCLGVSIPALERILTHRLGVHADRRHQLALVTRGRVAASDWIKRDVIDAPAPTPEEMAANIQQSLDWLTRYSKAVPNLPRIGGAA